MAKAKKTNDAAAASTVTADNVFTYGDKKYRAIKGTNLPMPNGAVKMTAADIATDTAAQKYLVENKCSCIEEVIE